MHCVDMRGYFMQLMLLLTLYQKTNFRLLPNWKSLQKSILSLMKKEVENNVG